MSYALRARIFGAQDLSSSEKLVMLELAHHHNDKTGQCNPSLELQRLECSLSERGLINILERLEERGKVAIVRGGGRAKRSNYVLFPEEKILNEVQGLEGDEGAETLNLVRPNSERGSGFESGNPERGSGASYERINLSSSSSSERDGEENSDALTLSLCEACALMPDALGEKHRGQLVDVRAWLRSVYTGDEEAALAVAERFGAWDKPKPPHLPQIKSDWKRMERIVRFQTQNANDSNVRSNGAAGQVPRRRQHESQNEFQRNAAERRAARAELHAKYACKP